MLNDFIPPEHMCFCSWRIQVVQSPKYVFRGPWPAQDPWVEYNSISSSQDFGYHISYTIYSIESGVRANAFSVTDELRDWIEL